MPLTLQLMLVVFSCTVLFVSISQVIGCEDRLQNDLYCVEWGVKVYSNQTKAGSKLYYLVTWACGHEQLAQSHYADAPWLAVKPSNC